LIANAHFLALLAAEESIDFLNLLQQSDSKVQFQFNLLDV